MCRYCPHGFTTVLRSFGGVFTMFEGVSSGCRTPLATMRSLCLREVLSYLRTDTVCFLDGKPAVRGLRLGSRMCFLFGKIVFLPDLAALNLLHIFSGSNIQGSQIT